MCRCATVGATYYFCTMNQTVFQQFGAYNVQPIYSESVIFWILWRIYALHLCGRLYTSGNLVERKDEMGKIMDCTATGFSFSPLQQPMRVSLSHNPTSWKRWQCGNTMLTVRDTPNTRGGLTLTEISHLMGCQIAKQWVSQVIRNRFAYQPGNQKQQLTNCSFELLKSCCHDMLFSFRYGHNYALRHQ